MAGGRVRRSVDDGDIFLVDSPLRPGVRHGDVGVQMPGREHDPSGVAIDAVDQADLIGIATLLADPVLELIEQRPGHDLARLMGKLAETLICDDDVVVVIEQAQRRRRVGRIRNRQRRQQTHQLAADHRLIGPRLYPIHGQSACHSPAFQQLIGIARAQRLQVSAQRQIKPLAPTDGEDHLAMGRGQPLDDFDFVANRGGERALAKRHADHWSKQTISSRPPAPLARCQARCWRR